MHETIMTEDHIETPLTDNLSIYYNKQKGGTEKENELKKQRCLFAHRQGTPRSFRSPCILQQVLMLSDSPSVTSRPFISYTKYMEKIIRQSTALKRARSRIAAQGRRRREKQLFKELADLLPLPPNIRAQLDKVSIIRLAVGYLQVRALLDPRNSQQTQNTEDISDGARPQSLKPMHPHSMTAIQSICLEEGLLDLAHGGFLLVTFLDGQVIFTTGNVNKYIGISQIDLIGRSLFDFMHPCDQQEVKQVLAKLAGNEGRQMCSMFWRTKNTVNLRPVSLRVLHCTGVKKSFLSLASHCLLLLCRPLPGQGVHDLPAGLNRRSFLSIHSPDMRFTYCDSRVWEMTGFLDTELFGQSVYKYYHTSDCLKLIQAHICLLSKGQVATGKYRLLLKHGGYVWVETEASVVYSKQTRQPQNILCINYVLSDAELSEVVFSLEQQKHSFQPHGLCQEAMVSALLADEAGQETAIQANGSALLFNTTGHTGLSDSSAVSSKNICEKTSSEKWDGDLDALAPYIPMDGEDSFLLPMLDYPREWQESSRDRGLSGSIQDVQHHHHGRKPHASECVWCSSNPAAIYVCQGQPQCLGDSAWTQRHKIFQTGNPPTQRHSGDLWLVWNTLRAIVQQECDAPQKNTPQTSQCYQSVKTTSIQSLQHSHPPNSRPPVSYPYPTWQRNRGGEACIDNHSSSVSMQKHSRHTKTLERHGKPRDCTWGQADSFPFTLPVLSHRECEVTAPLGSASSLLSGTEISSVLDLASTRTSSGTNMM